MKEPEELQKIVAKTSGVIISPQLMAVLRGTLNANAPPTSPRPYPYIVQFPNHDIYIGLSNRVPRVDIPGATDEPDVPSVKAPDRAPSRSSTQSSQESDTTVGTVPPPSPVVSPKKEGCGKCVII